MVYEMIDLQDELTDIPLMAGIKNLQVLFLSTVKGGRFPVTLDIMIPIHKRGAHMSRLIAERMEEGDLVETILESLAERIKKECGVPPIITACFVYPWRDQFAYVKVIKSPETIIQELEIYGITACPCSKETMGIGHMQRCRLKVKLKSIALYEKSLELMEKCFSAVLREKLKRPDEAEVIRLSQNNPLFVEDVVRNAFTTFADKGLLEAEAETYESIHSHNAYAKWTL